MKEAVKIVSFEGDLLAVAFDDAAPRNPAEIMQDGLPVGWRAIGRSVRGALRASRRDFGFDRLRWLRLVFQFFFLGLRAGATPTLAAKPGDGVETGVLSAFGFLASRLPRFRSLAIKSPFAPNRSARSTKNKKPRNPQEARGHKALRASFGRWTVTSPSRRYIRGRLLWRCRMPTSSVGEPRQTTTVVTLLNADRRNRISVKKI